MKKFIETPIVKVVRFEAKDVITTSCTIREGIEKGNPTGEKPIPVGDIKRVAESKGFGGGVNFSSAW